LLKDVVGMTRRALARGDSDFARRLRARARPLLRGLTLKKAPRGFAQIVASYFPTGARKRRRLALRHFLGTAKE
jgi:hypothetical protein